VTFRNRSWLAAGRITALTLVGALPAAPLHAQGPASLTAAIDVARSVPAPEPRISLDPASLDVSIARLVADRARHPADLNAVASLTPGNAVQRSRRSAIPWGILGGVVAGVAISGSAAARRGENEGGDFCSPCFLRWSAVTLPVGAAVGALTGYLIDLARR